MKITLKAFAVLLLLAQALALTSCADNDKPCEDILYEICDDLKLPAGQTYLCGAEVGGEKYLSENTACTLYGEWAEELFGFAEDYALYISEFALPSEIAVFRCFSSKDAEGAERICLERADILNVLLRETNMSQKGGAVVISKGKYVVMILTDDLKVGEGAVRGAL